MYTFTPERAAELIEDSPELATLRGYSLEEVWAAVEDPAGVKDEGEAFERLMDVMYSLRPVGHL